MHRLSVAPMLDWTDRHCRYFHLMMRGMMGRCPACGEGKLFRAFVKVADRCNVCGEDLHHHRADDFPAYLTIFLVGHLVVPIAMYVEIAYQPSYWLHTVLWAPMVIILSIGLLQPIKGAIIGLQWAQRMHGFDPDFPD